MDVVSWLFKSTTDVDVSYEMAIMREITMYPERKIKPDTDIHSYTPSDFTSKLLTKSDIYWRCHYDDGVCDWVRFIDSYSDEEDRLGLFINDKSNINTHGSKYVKVVYKDKLAYAGHVKLNCNSFESIYEIM